MGNHRKIYEDNFGPIPRDKDGKSYEIHHRDGNHENNDPANLQLVSMQEHYDIHYKQEDWGACYLLARKMHFSHDELSAIATKNNLARSKNGTNPFLGGKIQSKTQRRLVKEGKHHFLGGKLQKDLVAKGMHHFQDRAKAKERAIKRVKEGKCYLSQKAVVTCPRCLKSGDIGNMIRWHFNNCKYGS